MCIQTYHTLETSVAVTSCRRFENVRRLCLCCRGFCYCGVTFQLECQTVEECHRSDPLEGFSCVKSRETSASLAWVMFRSFNGTHRLADRLDQKDAFDSDVAV